MNYDGLLEAVISLMSGNKQRINTRHFSNDMTTFESRDDVLTLLVHLGYLGYDAATQCAFIPSSVATPRIGR